MNKEEIITILRKYNFDTNKYIVTLEVPAFLPYNVPFLYSNIDESAIWTFSPLYIFFNISCLPDIYFSV